MSPSDSRECLFQELSMSNSEIFAPLNAGQDTTLDLKSISLSTSWSESSFFSNSSEDLAEVAEEVKVLDFKDKSGLRGDLKFLLTVPEMCDVKFLVGVSKFPMYGVKAILASRSRVFFDMIISKQTKEPLSKHKARNWLVGQIKRLLKKDAKKEKTSQLVIEIPEFEPAVFSHILTYIQTGDIDVRFDSLMGVLNCADTFGLDGLRSACYDFARQLITTPTVLPLFVSAQTYSTYKWTKILQIEISKFICEQAHDVLRLPEFTQVPLESAIWILTKKTLRAAEERKWEAVLRWTVHNCKKMEDVELQQTLREMTSGINFCDISVKVLQKEIRSLGFLSDDVLNRAISHQTSPRLIIGGETKSSANQRHGNSKSRSRKDGGSRSPEILLSNDFFHMQPLASSTFNSSSDFSDRSSVGVSF